MVVALFLALIVGALVRLRLVRRFRVVDASMAPALLAGDRVVVVCWPRRWRAGQVVVLHDPERPGHVLVKRLVAQSERGLWVEGDNAAYSRDSRVFGWVRPQAVIGRAVWRYLPGDRRGWLPGSRP